MQSLWLSPLIIPFPSMFLSSPYVFPSAGSDHSPSEVLFLRGFHCSSFPTLFPILLLLKLHFLQPPPNNWSTVMISNHTVAMQRLDSFGFYVVRLYVVIVAVVVVMCCNVWAVSQCPTRFTDRSNDGTLSDAVVLRTYGTFHSASSTSDVWYLCDGKSTNQSTSAPLIVDCTGTTSNILAVLT